MFPVLQSCAERCDHIISSVALSELVLCFFYISFSCAVKLAVGHRCINVTELVIMQSLRSALYNYTVCPEKRDQNVFLQYLLQNVGDSDEIWCTIS